MVRPIRSRARSSIEANGPTAKFSVADSTPGCGWVGAMASAARTAVPHPLEVVAVEAQQGREFLVFLPGGVLEHGFSQLRHLVDELVRGAVQLFDRRQQFPGAVLFVQAGVDDRVAGVGFLACPRMHEHLLGGFVHRQQLAQRREGLFARFGVGSTSTWSNMSSMRLCCAFRDATTSSGDLTIMSAIADTSCVGRVGYARSGCVRLAQAYPPAESLNGGAYRVGAQPVSVGTAVLAARGALP